MKDNIQLDIKGRLTTHLSDADRRKGIDYHDMWKFNQVHLKYPEELVATLEDRRVLEAVLFCPHWRISSGLRTRLRKEIKRAEHLTTPVTPPTDHELLAYLDESPKVKCIKPFLWLQPGQWYDVQIGTFSSKEDFVKKKAEYCKATDSWDVVDHQCTRHAKDRQMRLSDNNPRHVDIIFRPDGMCPPSDQYTRWVPDSQFWDVFQKPTVPTVKEVEVDRYQHAIDMMELHEVLANFEYYPGQKEYIARVACKDYGIPAAQTGVGKTLVAISLMVIKEAEHILVMAPKATVKGSKGELGYSAAQWEEEIKRFAPFYDVHHLFTKQDLTKLMKPDGSLPKGVYVTYPEAFLMNECREHMATDWNEGDFCKEQKLPCPFPHDNSYFNYPIGLGGERGGIRCVAKPSMLTLCGHQFDMVILDEAHVMKNPDSQRTRQFLRLQPKYRYAMTATPISNTLPDICTLFGWVSVADWGKGARRNAVWPYALEDISRFKKEFLARDVDHTQSRKHRAITGKTKRFSAPSAQVSNPFTLLKLLKPVMAYIDKEMCNPNIVPCDVKEVRVPFGNQQEKLYRHYLDPVNIPSKKRGNVLVQQAFLRDVCCDPLSLSRRTKGVAFRGLVGSNLNPKLLAILDITRERMELGEQVLIVCSRIGQMDELVRRFEAGGVAYSRMDSTVKDVAAQSRAFKQGKTDVMLMGIQMAVGHSFSNCPNLIIGSLEWTYSAKIQAMGRVWRMNSPVPVRVWCILNQNSIEEAMFDRVATKEDAATLCLYGKRQEIQRVHVDASSITAEHIIGYQESGGMTTSETRCETDWPTLKERLKVASALRGMAA